MSESRTERPTPADRRGMRTGFTTGACAAAAAKAAARVLVSGQALSEIETTLPNRSKVTFTLKRLEQMERRAICSVIKDGGDDPDCTHGAELVAEVELKEAPGVEIRGGEGVAVVTKPGLGLEVGAPAINPVPRRNITEMVQEELIGSAFRGATVTISVPGGEIMAKQTINERLGLIGGISILGTTGIVKPYSTAAFRMSVIQAIDVAVHRGESVLVLTTGGKSETYAMALHPQLPEEAFIQVGDFIGAGISHCAKRGIKRAIVVGMMGKLSKMADGRTQTHQAGSQVNMEFLARLAEELGATEATLEEIRAANTARHVLEICQHAGIAGIASLICQKMTWHLTRFAKGRLEVWSYLVDFNGKLLGQYVGGNGESPESKKGDES